MVETDTLEGTIDNILWFHYDIPNDVLYLRTSSSRTAETYADEQADGTLLLRRQDNDASVGLTVVNWWKKYGHGALPDSIHHLEEAIEPFARNMAA